MALNQAQQNEIHRRANAGESGSALAKEFGVSQSAISRLKNHFTPTAVENSSATAGVREVKTVEAKEEQTVSAKSVNKAKTRIVVVNSNKHLGETYEVKAETLGQLLKEIGESSTVKAVFKDAKSGSKSTLEASTALLPDTNGEPLHLYLVPVKTNAGC